MTTFAVSVPIKSGLAESDWATAINSKLPKIRDQNHNNAHTSVTLTITCKSRNSTSKRSDIQFNSTRTGTTIQWRNEHLTPPGWGQCLPNLAWGNQILKIKQVKKTKSWRKITVQNWNVKEGRWEHKPLMKVVPSPSNACFRDSAVWSVSCVLSLSEISPILFLFRNALCTLCCNATDPKAPATFKP